MGFEFNLGPTFSFLLLLMLCFPILAFSFPFLMQCFPSCYCSPLCAVLFLFMFLLSSSPYCSPLHVDALFTLLLSSSCCYSPFRLFTLLGFPLCVVALLFSYSSILGTRFFVVLLSFLHCFLLLFVLLLCCYLKNLVLIPYILSCRNWEWSGVENQKPIFF